MNIVIHSTTSSWMVQRPTGHRSWAATRTKPIAAPIKWLVLQIAAMVQCPQSPLSKPSQSMSALEELPPLIQESMPTLLLLPLLKVLWRVVPTIMFQCLEAAVLRMFNSFFLIRCFPYLLFVAATTFGTPSSAAKSPAIAPSRTSQHRHPSLSRTIKHLPPCV